VPSRNFTGFGTGFLDYDNDGWLDIIVANGAAHIMPELARTGDPFPLHQTNQLFRNLGGTGFEETTSGAGEVFELSEVSRGVAIGDVDNDGDPDVLLTNNNGRARLLVNTVGNRNSWIGFRIVDETGRTDVPGARVEVVPTDGPTVWRTVRRAASYLSSNDPRVLVGLGDRSSVAVVRVHWPDGVIEEWTDPAVDRYLVLKRGAGREVDG
ncbi:MAG: CRTAC1 family protein, partial [Acidobacteriota bacterium]|nr:CRTAC1 family protein [Acidobacteriota bacterium]